MCAVQFNHGNRGRARTGSGRVRIEPVDNWHAAWKSVLKSIEKQGSLKKLQIDADGWLSARQVLLVAFVGDTPTAHVCFSVSPASDGCVEAKVVSCGIDARFDGREIQSQLHRAATERAGALGCEKLKGFRANSGWC